MYTSCVSIGPQGLKVGGAAPWEPGNNWGVARSASCRSAPPVESGCWLQIISQQSSFQIGRYWKNMWKVIPRTGFIYRFCGKIRKSTNIHLWSSNMARTSLIWGGVIGDHWTLQIKPSIDLTKPLYIIYHIIISWWLSDLAVRRPY